jgi:cellulose synthase/poly-beta-1,6-N-acetylglucosamine synthase-like glycosyltransferase
MAGFFNDEKVGAVTCPVLVRNTDKFWLKLQALEYKVISFTRKLLDYVDAVYVTPGPLALYRKKALEDISGFDGKNLTEDIEATWHLTHNRWERRMCLATSVSSTAPSKFRPWWRQRRRWHIGGLQCIYKYRKSLFRGGMLGWFIIPLFIISTFIGLLGLSVFFYLVTKRIVSNYLLTRYSIETGAPLITLDQFYITPSFLNYLGVVLFIFGFFFTILNLVILGEKVLKRENLLNFPFYMVVYLILYPFIMISAIWNIARRKFVWR